VWSPELLERTAGPATLRDVRTLEETHAGVDLGGLGGRHVRGWRDEGQARVRPAHRARPSQTGDDGQIATEAFLEVEHPRQLADGHPVPVGQRVEAHEAPEPRLDQVALHLLTA